MAEKTIKNPSLLPGDLDIELSGNAITAISGHPLIGTGGGTQSNYVYYPDFDETTGNIEFKLGTIDDPTPPIGGWHISGADGARGPQGDPGDNGKTPTFQIDPENAHWEWKYTDDEYWTDTHVVASGAVGPKGDEGDDGISPTVSTSAIEGGSRVTFTYGEESSTYIDVMSGTPGVKGADGISPTVSTETIAGGNRVTFTYDTPSKTKYIDVMSGAPGAPGAEGFSPTVSTTPITDDPDHPQGGTKVTLTDSTGSEEFNIWNGTDGQGATVNLNGGNGIDVTKNGNDYTIAVSADYATKAYAKEASAAAYYEALAAIPPLDDYYQKNETSGANEIATALAKKLDIEVLPNYDGDNGIYVDDINHKIGISADYKAQIEAVSGKVEYPEYNAVQDDDAYKVMNASTSAWEDLNYALDEEGVVKYNDLDTYFIPENGISAKYEERTGDNKNRYYFGLSAEYENAIKAVSGKVNAPPAGATGKKVYDAGNSRWEDFIITLPMNIGNNNTVTNDSIGVIGNNSYAGVKSMAISYTGATAISNSMSFGDGNYASANSMAAGWGVKAKDYSVIFGRGTPNDPSEVKNYSFAAGDAVFAYNYSQAFGRGLIMSGSTDASHGFGGMVIGGWNKTSADALFVAGNGTGNGNSRSDALVLTRDGKLTTNKVFVSGTNFDTLGQSRLDGNNTCLGTNWMGISQSHAGFLKYIDGQNAGDTEINNNGSGIQFEFKPNSTQGDLSVTNTNNGTSTTTKLVNVPATSYNSMSSFDPTNGPNYMIRKTASGFDIGAAVINVTSLPQQTEANAYYFVYDA